MISFKQRHFKKEMIVMLVRWYVAYALSYRDIEELASERGPKVDHSTINRWVIHYIMHLNWKSPSASAISALLEFHGAWTIK